MMAMSLSGNQTWGASGLVMRPGIDAVARSGQAGQVGNFYLITK
jgi:hypothetical protein